MDKGGLDPKPKDPKPAGAVGYDPKPFVPLRDSVAQPLIRCQDEYDPKPIKRSSMIVDGVWEDQTLNLRTLSRQVPLGMTLNPSSLSGTQWLNLWSKGF
jgi:hypothetical protein